MMVTCFRTRKPVNLDPHDEAGVNHAPNRRRGLLVVSVCTLVGLAAPGAGQPRDRSSEAVGTATISGRVLSADPRGPLSQVSVVARSESRNVVETSVTDADGRYSLTGLPAGRYRLSAVKAGYLSLDYGQTQAFGSGTPLQLEAGETLRGVDLQLPRGGVMTGRVLDEAGQPAVGVSVAAQRYQFTSGRWGLVRVGSQDSTDDRGIYRLFGLPPGEYYIEARLRRSRARSAIYYPGAADLASALRVSVALSTEVGGLDVVLIQVDTVRGSGLVVDAAGRPQVRARSVSLLGRNPPGLLGSSGRIRADGAFTIEGVRPGEYVLYASSPAGEGPAEFAVANLTSIGEDLDNIVLRTTTGATATGALAFDTSAVVEFAPSDLQLFTMPLGFVDVPVGRGIGRVNPDWSFEIRGMGDAQLIRILGLPSGWVLDSVWLNGADIIDQPVHLPAGRTTGGFRVVVTNRTTRLVGSVVDGAGGPVTDCTVVVFAADATRWRFPSRFVRVLRPDQHGAIDARNLPTGRYLAFAAAGIPDGAWTDPLFLERLRPTATRFTLGAGETTSVSITARALP